MGYAARANVNAQAVKRGELQPVKKMGKPHFKRPEFKAAWMSFIQRMRATKPQ